MSDIQNDTTGRSLICPKCTAAMETVSFHDIQIDRCTSCHGLWFDALEKDHLDLMKDAASIDLGGPSLPATAAAIHLNCPVCGTQMIDMVDHENPSLHFQSCGVCYGLFFDAGKYREHKEHHTMGFFRDLFHRKGR